MHINFRQLGATFLSFFGGFGLFYKIRLNKYPERIIHRVTTPKKIVINFKVITFFKSIASGKESPTTPIIKAIAVPKGIPFATKTCTVGKIPEALEYIGTAKIVAIGTANKLFLSKYFSKNPSGI